MYACHTHARTHARTHLHTQEWINFDLIDVMDDEDLLELGVLAQNHDRFRVVVAEVMEEEGVA